MATVLVLMAQPRPAVPVRTDTPSPQAIESALALGARVAAMARARRALGDVVIVPDARSYVEAVARWTPQAWYPVLIDDGSLRAVEDIARFVRAYRPARVVRWSIPEAVPGATYRPTRPDIESAVAAAWDLRGTPMDGLGRAWKRAGVRPPGIVVADERDRAWPAALALAAGRAQPIVWVRTRSGVNDAMTEPEAQDLLRQIRDGVSALGLSWEALGDDVDAVTLCLLCPARIEAGERSWSALTDRVGREGAARWAWAGQVFGPEHVSAAQAIAALFLGADSAWVFDSYPSRPPWVHWSGEEAALGLRGEGWRVQVVSGEGASASAWRAAATTPIDAGLILVNTRGTPDAFDLASGRCASGDVPMLERPAMVYFVHSFSAARPAGRATIAGRFLERGACAFLGAVDEPTLQAFVETPVVARRLAGGFPWGAAVRVDGPAWKLAVFGDPLITPGAAGGHTGEPAPLEGAVDLTEDLEGYGARQDLAREVRALAMLGRDAEAAGRFGRALAVTRASVTPEAARQAILPLFRAGDRSGLIEAFRLAGTTAPEDGMIRDALWLALHPVESVADVRTFELLRTNLRPEQIADDAIAISGACARLLGRGAAVDMLMGARQRTRDQRDRRAIDEAVRALGG